MELPWPDDIVQNDRAITRSLGTWRLNSLWPSDYIWRHRSWSTLSQVIACCLTAPSHFLKQCWLTSVRSRDNQQREISLEIPQPSVTKMRLKIAYLKSHWNPPGANEFMCIIIHNKTMLWTHVMGYTLCSRCVDNIGNMDQFLAGLLYTPDVVCECPLHVSLGHV